MEEQPQPEKREKSLEEIKAEARAFAYSGSKSKDFEKKRGKSDDNKTASDTTKSVSEDSTMVDDDYARFVKSLGLTDVQEEDIGNLLLDDEEDEFQWDPACEEEDGDDDDDDDDNEEETDLNDTLNKSSQENTEKERNDDRDRMFNLDESPEIDYEELQEELGWLADEELEAATSTLMDPVKNTPERPKGVEPPKTPILNNPSQMLLPASTEQEQLLKELLNQHFQLLFQLSVQAVRYSAAKEDPDFNVPPSCQCNHIEVFDHAIGMLEDLKQHRKDVIRKSIAPNRPLFTRSQFLKANTEEVETAFNIPGLLHLNEAFAFFDKSVASKEKKNLLTITTNADACRSVFTACGIAFEEDLLPGVRDLSTNLSDAKEILGPDFTPPCSVTQGIVLRKNVGIFTAAEDNLVLRGINSCGEKHWSEVRHQFLPDRAGPLISQRYSKLTMFIYRAHGVEILEDGSLPPIQKFDSVDDVDRQALLRLKTVQPPALVNVHRWGIEEDVSLLKGVQLLGSMWAEIRMRLIPHRDRGHLRKRYQVLERRIKNCVMRSNKHDKAMFRRLDTGCSSGPGRKGPRDALGSTAMAIARHTLANKSETSVRPMAKPQSSPPRVGGQATPSAPETPTHHHWSPHPVYSPHPPPPPPGGYYGYAVHPHQQAVPAHPYPYPQYPPYHPSIPYPSYYGGPHPASPHPPGQPYPQLPPVTIPYSAAPYPHPTIPPAPQPVSEANSNSAQVQGATPPLPQSTIVPEDSQVKQVDTDVGQVDKTAPEDSSRLVVEKFLLTNGGASRGSHGTRESKRGRRKSQSLYSGVLQRLGPLATTPPYEGDSKAKSPDPTDSPSTRANTPPVYVPHEAFTVSSVGTFHNLDGSPFLRDLEDSRPMTRTALFGGSATEEMEAATALKALGSPHGKRGVKRKKSLFAEVTGGNKESGAKH